MSFVNCLFSTVSSLCWMRSRTRRITELHSPCHPSLKCPLLMHSFPVLFDKMAVYCSETFWESLRFLIVILFNESHWERELPYVCMKKTPLPSKPTSFSGQNKRKHDIVKVGVVYCFKQTSSLSQNINFQILILSCLDTLYNGLLHLISVLSGWGLTCSSYSWG